jgi:LPS sulfotransferase NodH
LDSQKYLQKFSLSLDTLESELESGEDEVYSNVFVMSLPRSGSTLLTQILYNNTDLYCTNNFIARFWYTPLVGTQLSKLTIPKVALSEYESSYGRTFGIDQPHEFSRFWHQAIKLDNFENYDPQAIAEDIDWPWIKSKIINMNRILCGGIVFKPMELVGFHLNSFLKNFKRSIFIYLERDPIEVSLSILRARKRTDSLQWWGSYPPGELFDSIKNKSLVEQIAHQVCYFKKMYEEKFLENFGYPQLLRLNYQELCDHPNEVLSKIKDAVCKNGGELTVEALPESLAKSSLQASSEEVVQMQQALKEASTAY